MNPECTDYFTKITIVGRNTTATSHIGEVSFVDGTIFSVMKLPSIEIFQIERREWRREQPWPYRDREVEAT
jgi:hypothetical protein